ncbi:22011_t:CDS:2 [Rhizophagus irregularis]|nr:22011_t:CDS:2 [Rhizophagus irregularis]
MDKRVYSRIPKKSGKLTQKKAITTTEELDKAQIKKIFDLFDYNGNGGLSLAEIDRAIVELYPHLVYYDTAKTDIIKEAQKIAKKSKDGFINFKDFNYFIDYLHDYCEKAVISTKKLDEVQVKKAFDFYSNEGVLPLAEVNKAVLLLYPHLKKDKSAIMQAYNEKVPKFSQGDFINFKEFEYLIDALHYYNEKAEFTTRKLSKIQVKKDGVIDFNEFGRLIDLLHYYNELSCIFKRLDIDDNGRIDFEEFKKGHDLIGISVKSNTMLKEKFDEICGNNKKHIPFDEFLDYAAKIKLISEDAQGIQKTLEAQEIPELLETLETLEAPETRERETQETQPIISQKSVSLTNSSSQNQRWITFTYFCLFFIAGVGIAVSQKYLEQCYVKLILF